LIEVDKVLLCLTDTSLYIYICVKHFGMVSINLKLIKVAYSTNY